MPNAGPIFILGLQRGGTNQILNALRSHPDTVWPDGEFHEVLRPRGSKSLAALQAWIGYLPLLARKGDVLSPRKPPVSLDKKGRDWIVSALRRATAENATEVTRYKAALAAHGLAPASTALGHRMVVKLVNYNVGLAADLTKAYPDAAFVGLMRDPVGICESMMARGDAPEKILPLYRYVGETLLELEAAGVPVKTIRLEDMVVDFKAVMLEVYAACGLDLGEITGICLQSKERITDDDGHVTGTRKIDTFHDFESVNSHMRRDVNKQAIDRLSPAIIAQIVETCGPIMQRFGYEAPASPR